MKDFETHGVWSDAEGVTWRLTRLGPAALRLVADAPPSAALSHRLAHVRTRIAATRSPAMRDAVVGYRTVTIEVRPGARSTAARAAVVAATQAPADEPDARRTVVLPVVYDAGTDADELASRLDLPWREIVARHAAASYTVAFLGFTPGFPYLHGLPADLALPRRPTPRAMPAGAVAIADGRAGVYPAAGPGGWWLLGTTPTPLFEPWRSTPTRLLPGDDVRFEAVAAGSATVAAATGPIESPGPRRPQEDAAIEVLQMWPGGATLQARPRSWVGHLGMASAGALDPRARAMASHLAGAPATAASIEFIVPHAELVATRSLTGAWAGGGAALRLDGRDVPMGQTFTWPAGAHLEIRPDTGATGAVANLAVGGGLVPLAGATGHPDLDPTGSTDVRAGVGGFGRALVAGDHLATAHAPLPPDAAWSGRVRFANRIELRLHPGPHGEAGAYAALLTTGFRLAALDRMGARLAGPRVDPLRSDVPSEGLPLGAVQLPGDGRPIVLLADRGRTGGYAIVGVADPRDLPALAQARPGAYVTFVPPAR